MAHSTRTCIQVLLTEVVVSHSLTSSVFAENRSQAMHRQGRKDRKYAKVASRVGAEHPNVSVARHTALVREKYRRNAVGTRLPP